MRSVSVDYSQSELNSNKRVIKNPLNLNGTRPARREVITYSDVIEMFKKSNLNKNNSYNSSHNREILHRLLNGKST